MELRQLRYFIAVAEDLNFTRAAARLNITQPPLSVQINHLEEEIGTALFAREGRRVALTDAGRAFLGQAQLAVAHAHRASAVARQAAEGQIGHLAIGHNGPAELLILPQIVPEFTKRWPQVQLSFEIPGTPKVVEKIAREELDLGFVWKPVPTEDFDVEDLMAIPFVVVMPKGHILAATREVAIRDLSREPLVLYSRTNDLSFFHQLEQLFLNSGATMNVVYEFETLLSILNFVAMGRGCSVLPDYTLLTKMYGIVTRPMRPPNISRTMAIMKKRGREGLTEQFFNLTIERFRKPAGSRRRSARNKS